MIVLDHQLFRFDSHHPSQYFVQKLTAVHLSPHSFVEPVVAEGLADIFEADPIGREYFFDKGGVGVLLFRIGN